MWNVLCQWESSQRCKSMHKCLCFSKQTRPCGVAALKINSRGVRWSSAILTGLPAINTKKGVSKYINSPESRTPLNIKTWEYFRGSWNGSLQSVCFAPGCGDAPAVWKQQGPFTVRLTQVFERLNMNKNRKELSKGFQIQERPSHQLMNGRLQVHGQFFHLAETQSQIHLGR